MNQTPTELVAPYKAALVAAARDILRAAGSDGIAIEIPASIPPCTIVVGATDQLGKLLRTPSPEPMLGGRRAGDPPPQPLTLDEPGAGPRSWTALLSGDGGVLGKLGSKFETSGEHLERVDVVEAEPVLRQLGELQRENAELREQEQQLSALLPGVHYMDPPDGGSVSLVEQFKRMVQDAARYRILRDTEKLPAGVWHALEMGENLDQEVDFVIALNTPIPFCEPCKAGRHNECQYAVPCVLPAGPAPTPQPGDVCQNCRTVTTCRELGCAQKSGAA